MTMKCFTVLIVWIHLIVPCFSDRNMCKHKVENGINVTTELHSDVLLPCNFEPTLLGSDKTADIAAVWSQRTIPVDNLVEIRLQGEVMFWMNRNGRIEPFPKLSASGNFSILLHNVSESDLGLYRCQLFEGINCSIAYQEVYLKRISEGFPTWWITAGALGGAAALLSLLFASVHCIHGKCGTGISNEPEHGCSLNDNPGNDTASQLNTSDCVGEEEIQIYATVKKGKKA